MLTPFFTAVCDDNRHICDQGLTDRPPAHLCICLRGEDLLVGESHRSSRPPTWQTPGRPGITSFHILKPKGCPGVGLLDHMVVLFLVFFRNSHTVLHSGCINLHRGSPKASTYYVRNTQHVGSLCAKSFQSCLTLCDPMDCSPPGCSSHGILQARRLEWAAITFSRGSSQPRDRTLVPCIAGRFFTV